MTIVRDNKYGETIVMINKPERKSERKTGKRSSNITKMPDTRLKVRIVIVLGIINVFLIVSYFILSYYTVKNVQVDGNKHYSADEIKAMIMTGYFGDNSLYLSLKYKNKDIEGVPFVETMDVEIGRAHV